MSLWLISFQPTLRRFENGREAPELYLRRHPEDTELETAQVDTISLKRFKIGARVRQTARRIRFHLASGYPYRDLLSRTLDHIRTAPT